MFSAVGDDERGSSIGISVRVPLNEKGEQKDKKKKRRGEGKRTPPQARQQRPRDLLLIRPTELQTEPLALRTRRPPIPMHVYVGAARELVVHDVVY